MLQYCCPPHPRILSHFLSKVLKLKGRIKMFGICQRKSDYESVDYTDPEQVLWYVNTVENKSSIRNRKRNDTNVKR